MALQELVLGIRVGLKLLAPAIWNRVSGLGSNRTGFTGSRIEQVKPDFTNYQPRLKYIEVGRSLRWGRFLEHKRPNRRRETIQSQPTVDHATAQLVTSSNLNLSCSFQVLCLVVLSDIKSKVLLTHYL